MRDRERSSRRDEEFDAEEEEKPRRGRGRRDEEEETTDAVDFDDPSTGGGDPKFPPCTVDLELQSARLYWGELPSNGSRSLMFEATFKVYNVVDMPDELDEDEYEEDEERAPWPVRKGEVRIWRTKVGPKDRRNGKPPKGAGRVRDLAQALLRFVPRSKHAESAVDVKGKKVSWNEVIKDTMCGEDNELEGQRVRCAFTRIITNRGKGFPMIVPSFSLPKDVERREGNKIDSY